MFRKNIPVNCAYCANSTVLSNGEHCICVNYGMIRVTDRCSKFLYDPLKRQPSPPVVAETFMSEDFGLTEKAGDDKA